MNRRARPGRVVSPKRPRSQGRATSPRRPQSPSAPQALTSSPPRPPSLASPLLIIGYGNTLRSDDGVGPKAAEAIAALNLPGVETLNCALLTPELADPIARSARVVFVDAAVDAPREVQLRPLVPADSSQNMAHAADPRTLLALARDVFGHAPQAWWLTIPAENLGIGETLSPMTRRGLVSAVHKICDLVGGRHAAAAVPEAARRG